MLDIPVIPSNAWYELTVPFDAPDGTMVFEFRWNFRDASWYFNLSQEDGTRLVSGKRIVLGTYLGSRSRAPFFKRGVLVAIDTSNQGREAGFDDFGTRVVLRRFTAQEVMVGRGLLVGFG